MLKLQALVLCLCVSLLLFAQNPQAGTGITHADSSILKYQTIEEVLGLPSAYKVTHCELVFSSKGEIFKMEITSWADQRVKTFVLRAAKGDKLTLEEIYVTRNGVRKKLMPRTFEF